MQQILKHNWIVIEPHYQTNTIAIPSCSPSFLELPLEVKLFLFGFLVSHFHNYFSFLPVKVNLLKRKQDLCLVNTIKNHASPH